MAFLEGFAGGLFAFAGLAVGEGGLEGACEDATDGVAFAVVGLFDAGVEHFGLIPDAIEGELVDLEGVEGVLRVEALGPR